MADSPQRGRAPLLPTLADKTVEVMAKTSFLGLMLAACLAAPAPADGIAWRSDFEAAKREAAASGRLVLLHFSGPGCAPCRAMEQSVFNRTDVALAVEQSYVPVAVDVQRNPALKQQYDIRGIPADVIVTADAQLVNKSVGFRSAPDYVAALAQHARVAGRAPGERPAQTQASTMAPRVGQQYINEHALQPPPPPDAGVPGSSKADAGLFGPPASSARDPVAPPWQQRSLSAPPASSRPEAAPRRAGANSLDLPPWATLPTPGQNTPALGSRPAPPPAGTPADPSQGTPPNAPPVPPPAPGFGGYCPVTMYHEKRWASGDRRWGVIHEGRLYLFASEQAKDAFWRNPQRYAPALSGDDIVIFVETGHRTPGQVRIGAQHGQPEPRTFLFAGEASYEKFERNPLFYLDRLRQMTAALGNR
jgi:protein disulfide-isomerase